ncbi:DUF6600 domain-containing protein [Caenimonas aquaedulcis]|uniref:Chromosome partitioning protein ParA n=1 Tax=Caenimonas aquaedulcis TaxID=2793270 RepID=A0A931MI45_9BURK|nr:DUF6600 domain-containing protein [Caenimonas aquaedulcis]MBG9389448.1 chromosome partitioning protein ParA [Caenimonas aquaedulcis]
MKSARYYRCLLVLLLPLGAALYAHAAPQADPPWRVARLNVAEGAVAFAPAGDTEWTEVPRNRPLVRGDRLWTDKGSRAEIQAGSSAVRMDGSTQLEIIALDDQSAQLSVTQGTVYVRVRSLPELENFEIDTPNLAYRAAYPGDYRIDVDAANGTTRVTIHSGTGAAYGEGGQMVALGGGQQVTFRTKGLVQLASQESPPQDNFDRWAAERNRREDQSISARYVPREVVGYQQLDAHGQWSQDATLGAVWTPHSPPANWAPYRNGHWEWIDPWGWTWIDDAVWGFAPFHYGRWTQINSRWAWVPGRMGLKPVYAPALVAFIGGSNVAWFPLAPGEAWQPGYAASPVYMSNVNRNLTVQPNATYAFQRNPEALTAIPAEDFQRGTPAKAGWLRVAANVLTNAKVVPPPAVPQRIAPAAAPRAVAVARPPQPAPTAGPVAPVIVAAAPAAAPAPAAPPAPAAMPAKAAPPASAAAPAKAAAPAPVAAPAKSAPPAPAAAPAPVLATVQQRAQPAATTPQVPRVQQPTVQAQAQAQAQAKLQAEQARREQSARREQEAKREQLARREQAARREELARRAERAQREQFAQREQDKRRAESARRAELAKREEIARREELARRELARRELLAKRAEKQKLEQQARRAEQARREALAQREEAQRREAHAQHVEQARKAADQEAQALRDARAKREREEAAAKEREQRELAQREAQQREVARRDAELRQQQALAEQWRRDRAAWEQQQRDRRNNGRPDLREVDRRNRSPESRGIPILSQPMS